MCRECQALLLDMNNIIYSIREEQAKTEFLENYVNYLKTKHLQIISHWLVEKVNSF